MKTVMILIFFSDFIFYYSPPSPFLFQRYSSGVSVAFLFNSCILASGSSLVSALFRCLSFRGEGLLTGDGDLFSSEVITGGGSFTGRNNQSTRAIFPCGRPDTCGCCFTVGTKKDQNPMQKSSFHPTQPNI